MGKERSQTPLCDFNIRYRLFVDRAVDHLEFNLYFKRQPKVREQL